MNNVNSGLRKELNTMVEIHFRRNTLNSPDFVKKALEYEKKLSETFMN